MIATAIPHAAFDRPECAGVLDIVGRAGFIVDFVCNDCGATIACARQQDMGTVLQNLNFAAGLTSVGCPKCRFANKLTGLEAVYGFVCMNCRRRVDLFNEMMFAPRPWVN